MCLNLVMTPQFLQAKKLAENLTKCDGEILESCEYTRDAYEDTIEVIKIMEHSSLASIVIILQIDMS